MRVLLSDGSGLTSRQVAGTLRRAGHEVGIVTSDPWCLTRWSAAVRRVHPVPRFGDDPFAWLDAAVGAYQQGGYDVLLPTQEQVAVLARSPDELDRAGVATAVPSFDAVVAVQDKVSATATLDRLRVPAPDTTVVGDEEALLAWRRFPVYAKAPIGTASSGVRRLDSVDDAAALARDWRTADPWIDGGVVLQASASGPLVMVQSVFDHGRLVAFHANERLAEGVRGGASHKRSLVLPAGRELIERLGAKLAWHGALSADLVLTGDGPLVIDVNPRLVEPVNALLAGVDLVEPMLELAAGGHPPAEQTGRAGVDTHQLLLAVLGAAARQGRRRDVLQCLVDGARRRGGLAGSTDELQLGHGARGLLPVVVTSAAALMRPSWWQALAGGSVAHYALTPTAWRQVLAGRTP